MLKSSYPGLHRTLIGLFLLLTLFMGQVATNTVQAQGAQTNLQLSLNIDPAVPAGGYPVGQVFNVEVNFSCNATVGDCGDLEIDTTLPPGNFDIINIDAPSIYPTTNIGGGVLQTVSANTFTGGESGIVTLTLRVRSEAVGNSPITITSTGTISTNPTPVDAPPLEVRVAPPTLQWDVDKLRTLPVAGSGGIEPALDQNVTYRIRISPQSSTGNFDLTDITVVDTYPAGAAVVSTTPTATNIDTTTSTITWSGLSRDADQGNLDLFVVLNYPSGTFPADLDPGNPSDEVTNNVTVTADYGSTDDGPIGNDDETHGFVGPVGTADPIKTEQGSPLGFGGTGRFFLDIDTNTSNTTLENVIVQDNLPINDPELGASLPGPYLNVIEIQTGRWNDNTVTADVEYSTDGGSNWTSLGNYDFNDDTSITTGFPGALTNVRWVFQQPIAPGFSFNNGNRPEIVYQPFDSSITPANDSSNPNYRNQGVVTFEYDDDPANSGPLVPVIETQNRNIVINNTSTNIRPVKVRNGNNFNPGDEITFDLELNLTEASSQPLENLVIRDILPPELEFVSFDPASTTFSNIPAGPPTPQTPNPNFLAVPDYNGSGQTALFWSWGTTVPTGSTPGVANPLVIPAPGTGRTATVSVSFTARVVAGTIGGNYNNEATFVTDVQDLVCTGSSSAADSDDIDGDGNTSENTCTDDVTFRVVEAAAIDATKWIQGDTGLANLEVDPLTNTIIEPINTNCPDDGTGTGFTREPCVAQGFVGETFTYKLRISNTGNVPLRDYYLYDVLPYIGDTGSGQPLAGADRFSQWQPTLAGPIVAADAFTAGTGFIVEYSTDLNACRNEVATSTPFPAGCTDASWTASPADFSQVRVFRIRIPFDSTNFDVLERMEFLVTMEIPRGTTAEQISWNSFAQRVRNVSTGNFLNISEPPKVGIIVQTRPDDDDDEELILATVTPIALTEDPALAVELGIVDWGDLPDSFNTTSGTSGPNHPIVAGLRLGAIVDPEPNGQPSSPANGDGSDEDGVTFPRLVPGETVSITINATNTTGSPAFVSLWIDFDNSGFFEANEQVVVDLTVADPTESEDFVVEVTVPDFYDPTQLTYARARFSTQAGLEPNGAAIDGEVEDYELAFLIANLPDTGGQPLTEVPAWAILLAVTGLLAGGLAFKLRQRRT